MAKLGEVCLLKAGKFVSANDISPEYNKGLYPCFGGNGIRGYVADYTHDGEFPLIGRQGALCGNVNLASGKFHATEHAVVVQPKIEMNVHWLYYALNAMNLGQYATGAAQPGLAVSKLETLSIEIPNISEQNKIAQTLYKVEQLVNFRKQQLAKLDELVKARFVEMFGEPVSNPMGWEKKKLQDVCYKLTDGTHFSPESYDEGDYKYITAKNIKSDGFDFSNITYVPESVHRTIYERCNPELGDVLYIKDGATTGIAMVNSLEEEFSLLSSVALLKQNRKVIDGRFLCGVLNNAEMYKSIRSNMGGAAITRLTIAKLQKIMVIVPPLPLQKQFATFVKRVDQQKQTVQQSLEKLELMKKALMQEFLGKRTVQRKDCAV